MAASKFRPQSKELDRCSGDDMASEATGSTSDQTQEHTDLLHGFPGSFADPPRSRRRIHWHVVPPRPGRRRWLFSVGSVAVLALVLLFAIASRGWREPGPRKPNHKNKHKQDLAQRTLPCTTWPNDWELSLNANLTPTIPSSAYRGSESSIKPQGVKVIVIIFFGRREYVDVLDCYLHRNLVSNGGLVDEVHFLPNAQQEEDNVWLDRIVSSTPGYKKAYQIGDCEGFWQWGCLWATAIDKNTIYIKLDDDLVYVHEDTIPRLINSRIKHKEAYAIGGNVVNSFLTYAHWHGDAIRAYLPEPINSTRAARAPTWRASKLPEYPELATNEAVKNEEVVHEMKPPFDGHRWLPLRQGGSVPDVLLTPAHLIEASGRKYSVRNWALGAQQLYSLLENIEDGRLARYHVGSEDGMYDMQYERYNINSMAIWGSDVRKLYPLEYGDEKSITMIMPKKLGRPFLVDTHAIVGHIHFQFQTKGMRATDLLDRYRAYANEMVCAADRKKGPLGEPCVGFS